MSKLSGLNIHDIELDVLEVESKILGIGGVSRHVEHSAKKTAKSLKSRRASHTSSDINPVNLNPQNSVLLHTQARGRAPDSVKAKEAATPTKLRADSSTLAKSKALESKSQPKAKLKPNYNSSAHSHSGLKLKARRKGKTDIKTKTKDKNKSHAQPVKTQPIEQIGQRSPHTKSQAKVPIKNLNQHNSKIKAQQPTIKLSAKSLSGPQPQNPTKAKLPSHNVNATAVALKGAYYAVKFNQHMRSNYNRSLSSDLEQASLFERSVNTELQKRSGESYTKKRRVKMLGGIEHHNLKTRGFLTRALSYRPVKALSALGLVLVIVGYVAYLNLPSAKFKTAVNTSGINASQPSYTPEGYSLTSPYIAEAGKVALKYTNPADPSKGYSVIQESSSWDSKGLLENKVSKESQSYSTFTDRGLTIYVYDGKAFWMDQGKLNQIQPDVSAALETEDLVRIAGSM